jgi:hypothetical protein
MRCDQGCIPTAEKIISKRAKAEFRACLLMFAQAVRGVANVELLDKRYQYTTVTTMGKVTMVEYKRVCANWSDLHHRLRGDLPLREYQRVSAPAKQKYTVRAM